MRPLPRHPSTLLSAAFILPSLALAIGQNCEAIGINGAKFNLRPLDGVHSVSSIEPHPPTKINSTFFLNICAPLQKPKGALKNETCDGGTYGMENALSMMKTGFRDVLARLRSRQTTYRI